MDKKDFLNQVVESSLDNDEAEAENLARRALENNMDPLEVINEGFVAGIKEIGDKFEVGELFLPELI